MKISKLIILKNKKTLFLFYNEFKKEFNEEPFKLK